VAQYVYGAHRNTPDFVARGGKIYRLVADHLGSPRLAIDTSTGAVAERLDYDEWGKVTGDSTAGWMPFGFAGGLYDPDTGLVRFGARDYDATTGRWTGKDPANFRGGSSNLYIYALNDPVNLIDRNGEWVIVAVAVIAGVAYLAIIEFLDARHTYNDSKNDAQSKFGPNLWNTPGDAYKHCLASCTVSQNQGNLTGEVAGECNELYGDYWENQPPDQHTMDEINNAIGRSYAGEDCAAQCQDAVNNGITQNAP
jgi:RHS repeat-associated protein